MTLALANSFTNDTKSSDDHLEIVTTMNVEVSALLLVVVRHWSKISKKAPKTSSTTSSTTTSIIPMLKALRNALRWALEVSNVSHQVFTRELITSIFTILSCSPKGTEPFLLSTLSHFLKHKL